MSSKSRFLKRLGRRPAVVASLGDGARWISEAVRAKEAGADAVEVRADLWPRRSLKPGRLRERLRELREAVGPLPILLTLRRGEEGGGLSGRFRERERLALIRAGLGEADGVDIELAADDINAHVVHEAHKRGRFVILSAHDFKSVPPAAALARWARKAKRLKGDVLKVAAYSRSRAETDRLMDFCSRRPLPRRAFIPMGPLGARARREGHRWGSCLTYGYTRKPLAPGQPSVARLVGSRRPYP
jgi:3-dehydroquinate dehydratase-1